MSPPMKIDRVWDVSNPTRDVVINAQDKVRVEGHWVTVNDYVQKDRYGGTMNDRLANVKQGFKTCYGRPIGLWSGNASKYTTPIRTAAEMTGETPQQKPNEKKAGLEQGQQVSWEENGERHYGNYVGESDTGERVVSVWYRSIGSTNLYKDKRLPSGTEIKPFNFAPGRSTADNEGQIN